MVHVRQMLFIEKTFVSCPCFLQHIPPHGTPPLTLTLRTGLCRGVGGRKKEMCRSAYLKQTTFFLVGRQYSRLGWWEGRGHPAYLPMPCSPCLLPCFGTPMVLASPGAGSGLMERLQTRTMWRKVTFYIVVLNVVDRCGENLSTCNQTTD